MAEIPKLGNYGERLVKEDIAEFLVIEEIENVIPVRWDGIQSDWIICEQSKATDMAVIIIDEDGEKLYMMMPIGKTKNTYLLADAIMEG